MLYLFVFMQYMISCSRLQAGQTGYVDIEEQVSTIDNQRVVVLPIDNTPGKYPVLSRHASSVITTHSLHHIKLHHLEIGTE